MDLPDIREMDVKGKRVLVRADLNVPIEGGEITDDSRLRAALPTFRDIMDRGGRLIVISHLDRPGGKRDPSVSLRPVAEALDEMLDGTTVAFAEDCIGGEARAAVDALTDGDCVVMENLRFHPGEKENADDFAEALADLADIFVNDAFSASHRAHASITGVAGRRPPAAGLLMQKELETLDGLLSDPAHPYVAILGGAKAGTKLPVVEHLLDRADRIMLGGVMATTFLKARGLDVGASKVAEEHLETAERLLKTAETVRAELMLPSDVVVAREMAEDAEARVVGAGDVGGDFTILDIGPETIRRYADAIEGKGTLVWNGPMGAAELEPFRQGTHFLAARVAELSSGSDLSSVAGGGDTVAFLGRHRFLHMFTYASMAGGAFLQWLSGEPLPGVEALRKGY